MAVLLSGISVSALTVFVLRFLTSVVAFGAMMPMPLLGIIVGMVSVAFHVVMAMAVTLAMLVFALLRIMVDVFVCMVSVIVLVVMALPVPLWMLIFAALSFMVDVLRNVMVDVLRSVMVDVLRSDVALTLVSISMLMRVTAVP